MAKRDQYCRYLQGKSGKEILLFDPNTYASNKSKPITFYFQPSKDGQKVALILTSSGKGDINEARVINVDRKTFYSDSL